MTNYQLKVFEAMANNFAEEGEKGITLSKKDIELAQQKYRNGGFTADVSEFLPEGYRIERPKLVSAENSVQAYVTNGNESQSATLKFSFINVKNKNDEKANNGVKTTHKNIMGQTVTVVKNGNKVTKYCDQQRFKHHEDGEGTCNQFATYENGVLRHVYFYSKTGDEASCDMEYKFDEKGRIIYARCGQDRVWESNITYDEQKGTYTERFSDGETFVGNIDDEDFKEYLLSSEFESEIDLIFGQAK